MINEFRKLLVRIGKILPFVVCFLVCIHYAETAFALATSDFVVYDGNIIPNTRLSFLVGHYFEYNIQTLVVLVVLSISIRTCIYNKLACVYLGVNLLEKWHFDFEMHPNDIICVCLANVMTSAYLVYKGAKIVTRK